MTTYAARKALNAETQQCAAYGCKRKCTDDCLLCEQCQEEHRERNRAWWAKKRAQLSLDLSSVGLMRAE